MEKQKRKYLNDRKDLLIMCVRVAPYLGIGLILTTLAFRLAHLVPADGRIIIQIVFWILFLVMIILTEEPGWNFLLFIVFVAGAGLMLFWSSSGKIQPRTWILCAVLILISVHGRKLVQKYSRRVYGALIIGTLLFFLGWISLQFSAMPEKVRLFWILGGLILFIFILMCLINFGVNQNHQESGISLSIKLYVVLYNLFWLSTIL